MQLKLHKSLIFPFFFFFYFPPARSRSAALPQTHTTNPSRSSTHTPRPYRRQALRHTRAQIYMAVTVDPRLPAIYLFWCFRRYTHHTHTCQPPFSPPTVFRYLSPFRFDLHPAHPIFRAQSMRIFTYRAALSLCTYLITGCFCTYLHTPPSCLTRSFLSVPIRTGQVAVGRGLGSSSSLPSSLAVLIPFQPIPICSYLTSSAFPINLSTLPLSRSPLPSLGNCILSRPDHLHMSIPNPP